MINILLSGFVNGTYDLLGGRVDDLERLSVDAFDEFIVDEARAKAVSIVLLIWRGKRWGWVMNDDMEQGPDWAIHQQSDGCDAGGAEKKEREESGDRRDQRQLTVQWVARTCP